jgi:hypothetical protein
MSVYVVVVGRIILIYILKKEDSSRATVNITVASAATKVSHVVI